MIFSLNRAASASPPSCIPKRRRSRVPWVAAASLALFALTLGGAPSPAQAWEQKGHQLINGAACDALPPSSDSLRVFFAAHRVFLVNHSVDADKDKSHDRDRAAKGESLEGPRHFLDMDAYGVGPVFANLPDDYNAAIIRFGKKDIDAQGTVPWRIEQLYDALVLAFKNKNAEDILTDAAWLGHYVGDAHVPFHAAVDYDGRAAGQRGIHSYFEGDVLDRFIEAGDLRVSQGVAIRRAPHTLAFQWTRESFADVDAILEADAETGGRGSADGRGASKTRDINAFAKTARPIALQRLERASAHLSDLWYSAYLAAGKPDLSGVTISPGFGDAVTAQPVVAPIGASVAPLPPARIIPPTVTPAIIAPPTATGGPVVPASPDAPPAPVAPIAVPQTAAFIGNARSKIFHTPFCKGLPQEKNRIPFASRDEAIKAGFKPCPECKP